MITIEATEEELSEMMEYLTPAQMPRVIREEEVLEAVAAARNDPFIVGDHVKIHGLVSQTDLNGRRGRVYWKKDGKERIGVELFCGREIMVKGVNIRRIEPPIEVRDGLDACVFKADFTTPVMLADIPPIPCSIEHQINPSMTDVRKDGFYLHVMSRTVVAAFVSCSSQQMWSVLKEKSDHDPGSVLALYEFVNKSGMEESLDIILKCVMRGRGEVAAIRRQRINF